MRILKNYKKRIKSTKETISILRTNKKILISSQKMTAMMIKIKTLKEDKAQPNLQAHDIVVGKTLILIRINHNNKQAISTHI